MLLTEDSMTVYLHIYSDTLPPLSTIARNFSEQTRLVRGQDFLFLFLPDFLSFFELFFSNLLYI